MPEFTLEKLATFILVIVAFILFASILLGLRFGSEFWYAGCEGDIGGELVPGKGYANPICDILSDRDDVTCEQTTYKNITQNKEELPVCVWQSKEEIAGKNVTCFLNERLSCGDFNQKTTPKCQDTPDCRPIPALEAIVRRLVPSE